ncbi:lipopolysaccharide assembly protein LapB [Paraferrimonas sp. SM1919]|uniref:tetratricopeptide repeat protein n=1 Tax=Paraferrimonas sp. SM1919 TaxID=2662263 RepID=UPI0013D1D806|nr:hypothetical protein [Paraferrimonas sp. SM1919]
MVKARSIAAALLLGLVAGAASTPALAAKKGECPIDKRKSKAVGERAGKKVQKAFELYGEEKTDEALQVLLDADPSNDFDKAYVNRFIANLYAEKGNNDAAVKHVGMAVKADILGGSDHAGAVRLYADLLMQGKKYAQAVPQYQEWMRFTCKEDADVYFRIAVAHVELKQYREAIKATNNSIKTAEEVKKGPYQLKLTSYYNLKEYRNSIKVLEEMVVLFPEEANFWIQLAQFYLLVEDSKKSLATYELAYSKGFLESEGHLRRLSQLLSQFGNHYRAGKLWEKHMQQGKIEKTERHYKELAQFFQRSKDVATAAKYFGKAADFEKDAELYMKQGNMLMLAQKEKAAISVFKNALNAGMDNPGEAHFQLALANLALGNLKTANAEIQKAKKDKKTKKYATSYENYIKEKARLRNINLEL